MANRSSERRSRREVLLSRIAELADKAIFGIMPSAGLCRVHVSAAGRGRLDRAASGGWTACSRFSLIRHNQSAFRKASRRSSGR